VRWCWLYPCLLGLHSGKRLSEGGIHLIRCLALLHSFGGCHQCRSNPANFLLYGLVNRAGKLLLDIAAAGPYMLTTGRGKGDSGLATFVGYHGRHKSRPDHILMTPNYYHNLLSTDIQPSNEQIADHCSITAYFKVRQGGLTGADMNLEPQHVCHGGCPKHILRWNPDKAFHYAEHLGNNIEGHNSFMKAIERKDVEAANDYSRPMIISAACTSGMKTFSPCVFYRRNKE